MFKPKRFSKDVGHRIGQTKFLLHGWRDNWGYITIYGNTICSINKHNMIGVLKNLRGEGVSNRKVYITTRWNGSRFKKPFTRGFETPKGKVERNKLTKTMPLADRTKHVK